MKAIIYELCRILFILKTTLVSNYSVLNQIKHPKFLKRNGFKQNTFALKLYYQININSMLSIIKQNTYLIASPLKAAKPLM